MATANCCSTGSTTSHFHSAPLSSHHTKRLQTLLPLPNPTLPFRRGSSPRSSPNQCPKLLPNRRSGSAISALVSEKPVADSSPMRLTYLEMNGWLWDLEGLNVLVDPILVGNLNFGLPWLFDGAKKVLKNFRLEDLPELDCLLITQSLDDHCHIKTLQPLSKMRPGLPVVATPNAKAILNPLFSNVTYLEPGQSLELKGKNGSKIEVHATAGPILGPPWQRPENGYLISLGQSQLSLYYEPHCVYNQSLLEKYRADVVITPVIKQVLPSFTLVSGQEDAVQLVKILQAKFLVPMSNGDVDVRGILASILRSEGTLDSFKQLLSREVAGIQVLEPSPGVPLEIPVSSNVL